jgi:hypothetical protein
VKGRLHGVDKVLRNLNMRVQKIKKGSRSGLWQVGLTVQRASMIKTPVDTGNLKGSAYTEPPIMKPGAFLVEVGYTAAYAPIVHEVDRNYRSGQWKFLQTALEETRSDVLTILKRTGHLI